MRCRSFYLYMPQNDTLIFTCNTITLITYLLIFFDEEDALKIDDMPIKDTAYR